MKGVKGTLHRRNQHHGTYHFPELQGLCPELKEFVAPNHAGVPSIDFANPKAVKILNRALLKKYYQIGEWDIPEGYLCPPIPGRADYLHYLADLLQETLGLSAPPIGPEFKIWDVGVGANCVYPIVGSHDYGWSFVGSEIDPGAFASASRIVEGNARLKKRVEIRFQKIPTRIFEGLIKKGDRFHLSMSNPPFHTSQEEADGVNARKWRNLGKAAVTNFGGRNHELWCEGGEVAFIEKIIDESTRIPDTFLWFTAFVSKEASLGEIYGTLRKAKVSEWRTVEMAQGQKKSRFVAWRF